MLLIPILIPPVAFSCIFKIIYFILAGSLLLCGLSLVAGSRVYSSCGEQASRCSGFSSCEAWSPGHMAAAAATPQLSSTGSIVVEQELSCSEACDIFPDQESNLFLFHWPADSLYH